MCAFNITQVAQSKEEQEGLLCRGGPINSSMAKYAVADRKMNTCTYPAPTPIRAEQPAKGNIIPRPTVPGPYSESDRGGDTWLPKTFTED